MQNASESIDSNVFLTTEEVMRVKRKRNAVVYFPKAHETASASLSINKVDGSIDVTILPKSGCSSCLSYKPGVYGKEIRVFRRGIYTYEETLLLKPNKNYRVLFLGTGEVRKVKVTVVTIGSRMMCRLDYVDGERQSQSHIDIKCYGITFVIAK